VSWPGPVRDWGSSAAERAQAFPCDRLATGADQVMFRALDVAAPAEITFRWLCQLRAAPYSYDRLDNRGRRSPQTLTGGLEQLAAGQRVMTVFTLVEFEPGRSLTMRCAGRLIGEVVCTYRVDLAPSGSRIVVKLIVSHSSEPLRRALMRVLLPPGDLVMMRRQLLNLRALAERSAREQASA
jgi:hypothetical protein